MKKLFALFCIGLPLCTAAQIIKETRPVTTTRSQSPRQIRVDTVPTTTSTKSPAAGINNAPVATKPLRPVNTPRLIAELIPAPNLLWSAHYVASDPDVKPAVWVYEYHTGELKYITNKQERPQWQADFIWTHIPPGATAARLDISTQPFPATDEKNFNGIVDTRIIQKSAVDTVRFSVSYKEKSARNEIKTSQTRVVSLTKNKGAVFTTSYSYGSLLSAAANYGNYYVRITPLDASGKKMGNAGNTIKVVPDFITWPPPPVPTSEDSLQSDYEITSVKYTPMHYPEKQFADCKVVTGYNEEMYGPTGSLWNKQMIESFKQAFPIGTIICPSPPSEPSWYEKAFNSVVDAATIAVNGASKVYNETKSYLKNKFSEYMCNYDPVVSANKKLLEQTGVNKQAINDGCNTATGIAFEAAMTYAGMPPSIPNYDEMCRMAKGQIIDLLIQKAAEQTGMPCDEACRQLIMEGYDKMVTESAAKNIEHGGFFNYKPDPRGQYRLPYVEIEVTRKRQTQKGGNIITSLYFTPGVEKTFNLTDTKGQAYSKTIKSYDLYESIKLPVPYLQNVGDKIKLVAVLTPKFAYANFDCSNGRLNSIDTHQHFCPGINMVETGEDPKNSSGYSMMVEKATIHINPAGKIKLATIPPTPGKIGLQKAINTSFPHYQ
jgi:hypothetical protein